MPQLLGGLFVFALVVTIIMEFWKYILGIILFVAITALITYEFMYLPAVKDKSDSEKTDIQDSYLRRYFLCICLALATFFIFRDDVSRFVNKINSPPKTVQQNKTPEQIQAEKEKVEAEKKAKEEKEKLQKNVERANSLSGEEKIFYDSKFKEYINSGVDENSAREKSLADLDEMLKQKAEEKRKAEEEQKLQEQAEKSRILAEQRAEEAKKYLAENYKNAYSYCYWMFYKIGYSDDVLQYHMNSDAPDAMSDLNFVMNKFVNDLNDDWKYSVDTNFPDDLKNLMYKAKGNLQKSFQLRKNGNRSEIQQSDELENEVVQQLIQIQQMLPEGVKMWSYQGIYDQND